MSVIHFRSESITRTSMVNTFHHYQLCLKLVTIKLNWRGVDGPEKNFQAIVRTRLLFSEVASIIKPYISRNAYFALTENFLLAMLCDESREVRSKAVDKIVSLRKIKISVECRKFEIPPLNFDASSWWEIVPLQKISAPPLILKESLMEIEETLH